jgi:hypothetical protein
MFGDLRKHSWVYIAQQLFCLLILADVNGKWGHAVAQLVEALHYKSEDRGFDSRWCQWNFSLT